MNKDKKMLVDLAGAKKKDERTRSEVLAETDVYISTLHQNITESLSSKLPEKAVLISLKAESVTKQKKQTLVSTLPDQPNHITDVHIAAGIVTALCEGKKWSEGILSQAIKGFATVYKTPKSARLLPGLLEKNMAKKIAKSIK